jgi:hypothetical protein
MALRLAIIRVPDTGDSPPEILLEESLYELLKDHFGFRAEARASKLATALEAEFKLKTVKLP